MKNVLIFGGAGALGRVLTKKFLDIKSYNIHIASRDEAKHHNMKQVFDSVNYHIVDVRNFDSIKRIINIIKPAIIINCAALKQVPACEFFPHEALMTNVLGTKNIIQAIEESVFTVEHKMIKVISISTDKACKPVNSYGMTKALQERVHLNGRNFRNDDCKIIYNCVRYGNVLESTSSVIPLFKQKLQQNLPLTITDANMTRFLLSLNQAVDLIFKVLEDIEGGKIFIPKVPSARIVDLAECMVNNFHHDHPVEIQYTGIRPGEKIHEILISEEELMRTEDKSDVLVIHDIKNTNKIFNDLQQEYSSKDNLMNVKQLNKFLKLHNVY